MAETRYDRERRRRELARAKEGDGAAFSEPLPPPPHIHPATRAKKDMQARLRRENLIREARAAIARRNRREPIEPSDILEGLAKANLFRDGPPAGDVGLFDSPESSGGGQPSPARLKAPSPPNIRASVLESMSSGMPRATEFMGHKDGRISDADQAEQHKQNMLRHNVYQDLDAKKSQANKDRWLAGIAEGLGNISLASAGDYYHGTVPPRDNNFKAEWLRQRIAENDLATSDENDPRSEASRRKRELYKTLFGVDVSDMMSANDLDMMVPQLAKSRENQLDRDLAREGIKSKQEEFRAEQQAAAAKESEESDEKMRARVEKAYNRVNDDKEYRDSVGKAQVSKDLITALNTNAVGDIKGVMDLITAAQGNQRISDKDVQLFKYRFGIMGLLDRAYQALGSRLSPSHRREIIALAKKMAKGGLANAKRIRDQAIRAHTSKDMWPGDKRALEGMFGLSSSSSTPIGSEGGNVPMVDPEGNEFDVDPAHVDYYEKEKKWRKQ